MKRSNSEDLIAIKDDKGSRLFREEETKLHAMNYYKKLYTKRDSPIYYQQWTNFKNNQVKKYLIKTQVTKKNTAKTLHCIK